MSFVIDSREKKIVEYFSGVKEYSHNVKQLDVGDVIFYDKKASRLISGRCLVIKKIVQKKRNIL